MSSKSFQMKHDVADASSDQSASSVSSPSFIGCTVASRAGPLASYDDGEHPLESNIGKDTESATASSLCNSFYLFVCRFGYWL